MLFIAADRREFAGTLKFWEKVEPLRLPVHWSRSGLRKGRPVIAIANGAGWERARLASESVEAKQLCNIGYCGALDPELEVAQVVISSEHLPVTCSKQHTVGKIFSSPCVVNSVAERKKLFGQGNIAVEMEHAGINRKAFYCIKVVSDLADEEFSNDFGAAYRRDGSMSVAKLMGHAFQQPWQRLPELIRLGRRSAFVSQRLGEFLNACEF